MGIEDQIINLVDRMAAERFQNRARLAEFCGVTNADLSRWLNRERRPLKSIGKLLDALGIQISVSGEEHAAREVCFVDAKVVPAGEGLPKPEHEDYYAVPLVDDVGAGGGIVPNNQFQSWFLVWKHQAAVRNKTDMIAVRLANTAMSMQPTLWPGDIVLVHLGEKTVDYPGKIWLVKDPDGEGKIKRVSIKHLPQEKDDQITYYSDNAAEYPPEVYSLKRHFLGNWGNAIVGRVLWGWTDLTRK